MAVPVVQYLVRTPSEALFLVRRMKTACVRMAKVMRVVRLRGGAPMLPGPTCPQNLSCRRDSRTAAVVVVGVVVAVEVVAILVVAA